MIHLQLWDHISRLLLIYFFIGQQLSSCITLPIILIYYSVIYEFDFDINSTTTTCQNAFLLLLAHCFNLLPCQQLSMLLQWHYNENYSTIELINIILVCPRIFHANRISEEGSNNQHRKCSNPEVNFHSCHRDFSATLRNSRRPIITPKYISRK